MSAIRFLWLLAVICVLSLASCGGCDSGDDGAFAGTADSPAFGPDDDAARAAALKPAADAVTFLHTKKRAAKPGEWLDRHREDGQTFDEYVKSSPNRPTAKRTAFYILPLGDFDEKRKKLIADTAEMMGIFFGLSIKTLEPMGLDAVPRHERRGSRGYGPQLSAGWVLTTLKAKRADDAVGVIALSSADLWPGEEGWNFVFGQASLSERVGVWSMARFGDPHRDYTLVLRRTLQTATHEVGHMLGIQHCILWECGMNGSNHLEEADATPMPFCPECDRKIWWACRTDPAERYRRLADFCKARDLTAEAKFWRKSVEAVGTAKK
jgi:archaemetzincin